jgi:putative DNA-invertase from lambdoid prophage Rac
MNSPLPASGGIQKQKAAAYLRCSTSEQNTDVQRNEILAQARARGWDLLFYEDKATGTTTKRVSLQQLLHDARQGKISVIIVWKLDRFARSLKDLVCMLQELADLGVTFVSLRDNLDFSTSSGRLMFHIIGAFSEFEASLIKERVKAGIANAKSKGTVLGRPRQINTAEAARLRGQGYSMRQIGKRLGVSKSAVHKTLSDASST